jgi:hypothetical protein
VGGKYRAGRNSRPSSQVVALSAQPEVAKYTGRYICLRRGVNDEANRYFADDSLVELAKALGDAIVDWSDVERALLDKGVWSHPGV